MDRNGSDGFTAADSQADEVRTMILNIPHASRGPPSFSSPLALVRPLPVASISHPRQSVRASGKVVYRGPPGSSPSRAARPASTHLCSARCFGRAESPDAFRPGDPESLSRTARSRQCEQFSTPPAGRCTALTPVRRARSKCDLLQQVAVLCPLGCPNLHTYSRARAAKLAELEARIAELEARK